jgi:hypothetical protein
MTFWRMARETPSCAGTSSSRLAHLVESVCRFWKKTVSGLSMKTLEGVISYVDSDQVDKKVSKVSPPELRRDLFVEVGALG